MIRIPLQSVSALLVLILQPFAYGELKLPHLLSDHMVVQHDQPTHFWGWGEAGETVSVTFGEKTGSTAVEEDGTWSLEIPPPPAGGPYQATIQSQSESITLKDILSGEVWVASGQSNMAWKLDRAQDSKKHIAEADLPKIRSFKAPKTIAYTPKDDISSTWRVASPNTVAGFSAVAWFFAKEIHETQKVPVGILQSAWGGTYVEAWTPFPVLKKINPKLQAPATTSEFTPEERDAILAQYETVKHIQDPGNRGALLGWQLNHFDDKDWPEMTLPGSIEGEGHAVDGAFWFRREVKIPPNWKGKDLILSLGKIDDYDVVWVNGVQIGETGPKDEDPWLIERRYTIPAKVIAKSEGQPILISIRVFDRYGIGGFTGKESDLFLKPVEPNDKEKAISLTGTWKYFFETQSPDLSQSSIIGTLTNHPNQPGVLFNGMIHPLLPYPIRGAIWYQGESNAGHPEEYATIFPAMIESWRELWKVGDFPFFYVQLASFKDPQNIPSEGGWALIREAQQAALLLPNVGEAIILDAGEADDIHPRDKVTPGHRLALQARKTVYGEDIPFSSPYLQSWETEGATIRLHFSPVYEGLEVPKDSKLDGFAIQGEDDTWYWADAKIVSPDTIELSHPEVTAPQAARYAWANNPRANVTNSEGLPLSPFRTDR
ncbi:sialate O-acetylesterase [Puniceicoccus vermicola]|uniref:9-O-acetylesterase n=1 Tax=Puniceicoccus vermicola TaxID=388746 RepID=A0A7X1B1R6_9BACT|nr:sialate O-acetylesterase [Puniceicoccus vermicola]MBC2603879.1 9-O-acetylesterase [Puniceicoccus vermicola]